MVFSSKLLDKAQRFRRFPSEASFGAAVDSGIRPYPTRNSTLENTGKITSGRRKTFPVHIFRRVSLRFFFFDFPFEHNLQLPNPAVFLRDRPNDSNRYGKNMR